MAKASEYFLAALRDIVDNGGMKQVEIERRSGIARQTVSSYYKGKKDAGIDQQELIAEACGMSYIDFLQRGKEILEPVVVGNRFDYMSCDDFRATLAGLEESYVKVYDRLRLWRSVFENMPIPSLVIRDKVVVYQNKKSREWGVVTGGPLCDKCIDIGCKGENENCAIKRAINDGIESQERKTLGETDYLVQTFPLHQNEHDYTIVSATVIEPVEN